MDIFKKLMMVLLGEHV